MKALSLYAPYAHAIAIAMKTIELRSWRTSYRGSLLICCSQEDKNYKKIKDKFIFGKAIAIVDVIDCVPYDKEIHCEDAMMEENEDFKGYAWILDNIRLIEPVDVKGQQRIFNVDITPNILDIDCYGDLEPINEYWLNNNYIKEIPYE